MASINQLTGGEVSETELRSVSMLPDGSGYASGNDGMILYRSAIAASKGISPTWNLVYLECGTAPGTCDYPPLNGVSITPNGAQGWAVGGLDAMPPVFAKMTGGTLEQFPVWLPLIDKN